MQALKLKKKCYHLSCVTERIFQMLCRFSRKTEKGDYLCLTQRINLVGKYRNRKQQVRM
jgi:hypothetical protein